MRSLLSSNGDLRIRWKRRDGARNVVNLSRLMASLTLLNIPLMFIALSGL